MYFFRLLDILRDDYAAVVAVLGDEPFHNLVTDYLLACPSQHPSVRNVGERLPRFIDGHALGLERRWLGELARLERARLEVFDGPDAEPLPARRAARAGARRVRRPAAAAHSQSHPPAGRPRRRRRLARGRGRVRAKLAIRRRRRARRGGARAPGLAARAARLSSRRSIRSKTRRWRSPIAARPSAPSATWWPSTCRWKRRVRSRSSCSPAGCKTACSPAHSARPSPPRCSTFRYVIRT